MQLFIDSADIEEVRRAYELGVISGVTTNPKLAATAGPRLALLRPMKDKADWVPAATGRWNRLG